MTDRPRGDDGPQPQSLEAHVQHLERAIAVLQRAADARPSAAGADTDKPRARSPRRTAIADWAAAAIVAGLFALALYLVSEARKSSDAAAVSAAAALESSSAALESSGASREASLAAAGSANSARKSLEAAQDVAGDAESSQDSARAAATAAQAAKSHAEASAVSARESSEVAGGAAERTASWTESARAAAASARAAESRAMASAHASSEERRTTLRDIESVEEEMHRYINSRARRLQTGLNRMQTELNHVKKLSESVADYTVSVEACYYRVVAPGNNGDRYTGSYDTQRKDDIAILSWVNQMYHKDIDVVEAYTSRNHISRNWAIVVDADGTNNLIEVLIVFMNGIPHENYRDGGSKVGRDGTHNTNVQNSFRKLDLQSSNSHWCS